MGAYSACALVVLLLSQPLRFKRGPHFPPSHHHTLLRHRHTFMQAVIANSFSDNTKENKTATASVMNRSIAQWGSPLRAVSSADRCVLSSMCVACTGLLPPSQMVVKCARSSLWNGVPSPHRWLFPLLFCAADPAALTWTWRLMQCQMPQMRHCMSRSKSVMGTAGQRRSGVRRCCRMVCTMDTRFAALPQGAWCHHAAVNELIVRCFSDP